MVGEALNQAQVKDHKGRIVGKAAPAMVIMKSLTDKVQKMAGMRPAEWNERTRQALLKSGERWFGLRQGEKDDRTFRRGLRPPFNGEPIEAIVNHVLTALRGMDFSRRPLMPLFGSRDLSAALFRRRFPRECGRLLDRADRAIHGRFDLLGLTDVSFGDPIDWHLEPLSGKRTDSAHWSAIDYLNPSVAGDKKITWALNRHGHFVTLGQAYLVTKDERFAGAFINQLSSWLDDNPPRRGINWTNSLEVAFRSIAWLWALQCFARSPHLTPSIIWRVLKALVQQGSYVESYLSRNLAPDTHLTGEALGLFYLGTALPWVSAAARWRGLGLSILLDQLTRQVQADGVYFEQASYYHRYTTDFYVHTILLARAAGLLIPPAVEETIKRLMEHLMWITRPDGLSTRYGDEDGGRLLALHDREAADFRDTLQVGAVLCGDGRYKWMGGAAAPEVLWLLGPEGLEAYDRLQAIVPKAVGRRFTTSGLIVLRDGWNERSSYVFVDAGKHGAMNSVHAHADALSFEFASAGTTWIVDPGTYTFTKDPALRNEFRSSTAHNTLVVEGQSQSQPNGPFSWLHVASTALREFNVTEDAAKCRAEQNGYGRLNPPVRHQRSFQLLKRPDRSSGSYLLIHDGVATAGSYRYQLRFHLGSDCKPAHVDGRLVVSHENGAELAVKVWLVESDGRTAAIPITIEPGWVSPAYGRRIAAPVLVADARSEGTFLLVTVLAAGDEATAIDLEALALLDVEQDLPRAA